MPKFRCTMTSEEHIVVMTRDIEAADEFMAEALAFDLFKMTTELEDPKLMVRIEGIEP